MFKFVGFTCFKDAVDCGHSGYNSCFILNDSVLHWNVEVDSHKDSLALLIFFKNEKPLMLDSHFFSLFYYTLNNGEDIIKTNFFSEIHFIFFLSGERKMLEDFF